MAEPVGESPGQRGVSEGTRGVGARQAGRVGRGTVAGPSRSEGSAVPRPALDDLRLPDLDVRDVVWHSRQENDWYAATVTVDCLAFLYVAFLYQVRRNFFPGTAKMSKLRRSQT